MEKDRRRGEDSDAEEEDGMQLAEPLKLEIKG
jgi:hypothetical protein